MKESSDKYIYVTARGNDSAAITRMLESLDENAYVSAMIDKAGSVYTASALASPTPPL